MFAVLLKLIRLAAWRQLLEVGDAVSSYIFLQHSLVTQTSSNGRSHIRGWSLQACNTDVLCSHFLTFLRTVRCFGTRRSLQIRPPQQHCRQSLPETARLSPVSQMAVCRHGIACLAGGQEMLTSSKVTQRRNWSYAVGNFAAHFQQPHFVRRCDCSHCACVLMSYRLTVAKDGTSVFAAGLENDSIVAYSIDTTSGIVLSSGMFYMSQRVFLFRDNKQELPPCCHRAGLCSRWLCCQPLITCLYLQHAPKIAQHLVM